MSELDEDYHIHSNYSDGKDSVAGMLAAAHAAGRRCVALADHAAGWIVSGRMHHFFPSATRLRNYFEEIRYWRAWYESRHMRVFAALEIEVFSDGTLNIDPGVREIGRGEPNFGADFLIGAVHSESIAEEIKAAGNADTPEVRSETFLRSCEHIIADPRFRILAHPEQAMLSYVGREFLPNEIDRLISALKRRLCSNAPLAIEVNCKKGRASVKHDFCFLERCRDAGARFVVSSDAHSVSGLTDIDLSWKKQFMLQPNEMVGWASLMPSVEELTYGRTLS